MKNNEGFEWIVRHLESNEIPYQVCGGLAAIAYGSKRKLNDIDVFVPEDRFKEIVKIGGRHISFGPSRYEDQYWNVYYVQFIIKGQKVEVGSDRDVKIYDEKKGEWTSLTLDFDSFSCVPVLGREARVMIKSKLIDYKSKLARDVDREDIYQISRGG